MDVEKRLELLTDMLMSLMSPSNRDYFMRVLQVQAEMEYDNSRYLSPRDEPEKKE